MGILLVRRVVRCINTFLKNDGGDCSLYRAVPAKAEADKDDLLYNIVGNGDCCLLG